MTLAEIDVMKQQVTLQTNDPDPPQGGGDTTAALEDRFKRMLVDRRATAIEAFHGEDETTRIEKLKVPALESPPPRAWLAERCFEPSSCCRP